MCSLAKAYIESSLTLNRTIHTEIHRQTNFLRLALEALESNDELTFALPKTALVLDDSQTNKLDFTKDVHDVPCITTEKAPKKNISNPPAKKSASGHLFKYLKDKTLKSGAVASYPRVQGKRDPNRLEHLY